MARKEKASPKQNVSSFLSSAKGEERKDCGGIVGLQLPSLALMYLLESNVLPLSKGIGIAGPYQSNKSTFGFEILRWFANAGGASDLIETEGDKVSGDLIPSLLGPEAYKAFRSQSVSSIEEAQTALTRIIDKFQGYEDRNFAVGVLLDSLSGSNTEGASKTINEEGHATQDYARAASLWTSYFKTAFNRLPGWPMTLIYVNHLKDAMNAPTGTKTTPGGVAQYFHASIYIWLRMMEEKQYKTWKVGGKSVTRPTSVRRLRIKCEKNSLGSAHRQVDVNLIWYPDLQGTQITEFDWMGADALFVASHQDDVGLSHEGEPHFTKLAKLCDMSCDKNLYSSKRLKLDGAEGYEAGLALRKDVALWEALQLFFLVKRHKVWHGEPMDAVPPTPEHESEPIRSKPKAKEVKADDV
jgi:hypothetical protein